MANETLFKDEAGALPIVGLLLIVGMTTVTVAYAGPAIQENYMSQTESGRASADFEFSFDPAKNSVVMMHSGGDSLEPTQLYYQINSRQLYTWNSLPAVAKNFGNDGSINHGDYAVVGANTGDRLRVIARDGGGGYILASFDVPTDPSLTSSQPLIGSTQIAASANFLFSFNSTVNQLTVTHNGGSTFNSSGLNYQLNNGPSSTWASLPAGSRNLGGDGKVDTGDNITLSNVVVGDVVNIRVTTNGSSKNYIIATHTVTGGKGAGNQTTGNDTGLPDSLTLTPSSHEFVVTDDDEDDKEFTLTNTGNETVGVSGISLDGGSGFTIDKVEVKSDEEGDDEEEDTEMESPYSFDLESGGEARIDVEFGPLNTQKSHDPLTQNATLKVTSPDAQNVSSELSGTDLPEKSGHIKAVTGDGTVLANSKGNADGKDMEVTESKTYGVTVSNEHGNQDLYVYEVELDDADGEFALASPFDTPYHTIKAKDGSTTFSEQLSITYTEKEGEDHEADVTIKSTSNDHEDLEFTVKKAEGDNGDEEDD